MSSDSRNAAALSTPSVQEDVRDAQARTTTAEIGSASDTTIDVGSAGAGRYTLENEIGRGGMGIVYRAVDRTLERKVAVKVLNERFGADGSAARRFVDEARITGQLQHPGIPAIHDLGILGDGRPFLAMKLVQGQTLDRLMQQHVETQGDRSRFVAVFEQICQTVAYAHEHRVIHRDLKPANIMVGSFGEVQIMDWGLAKVLPSAETSHHAGADPDSADSACPSPVGGGDRDEQRTQAGSVLGTPTYMSPEQARGAVEEVDERSDVFALGAILCAMLTGKPPYAGADSESIRRRAAEADLGDAFTRLDRCEAEPELVELCKQCLSPSRPSRPAHAGEVAARVAALRAAADERARRAELERVKVEAEAREQRKRRRVSAALAAAVLALLLGSGAFLWWRDRLDFYERERQIRNAEAIESLAHQCEDAIRANDTAKAGLALEQAEKRVAEANLTEFAETLRRCRSAWTLLLDLDSVDRFRWTVADGKLPQRQQDAVEWRKALAAYGIEPGKTSTSEAAARIAQSPCRDRLLTTLDLLLIEEQLPWLRELLQEVDADAFRDSVRDATMRRDAGKLTLLIQEPRAQAQPAWFAAVLGQNRFIPDEHCRKLLLHAVRARSNDLGLLMAMGNSYRFNQASGASERLRWFQAALAVTPRNAAVIHNLGVALRDTDDIDGAIAAFEEAMKLDPRYAGAITSTGVVLADKQNYEGAIAAYNASMRLDPKHHLNHYNLGVVLRNKKDLDGALSACQEAIRLNPKYAPAHLLVGAILHDRKKLEDALAAAKEAVRLDPLDARAHFLVGLILRDAGRIGDAFPYVKEAVRLDPKDVQHHYLLASAFNFREEWSDAVRAAKEAVRLNPSHTRSLNELRHALFMQKDYAAAANICRQIIELAPNVAQYRFYLGDNLAKLQDFEGAVKSFRESLRLDPNEVGTYSHLGFALLSKGDAAGAIAAYQDAVQRDPKNDNAHINLAWLLATGPDKVRDGRRAVEHGVRACELAGSDNAHYLNALAAAHAEAGDFDKAVALQKKALAEPEFEKQKGPAARQRLDLYLRNMPYRDPTLAAKPSKKSKTSDRETPS